MTFDLISIGDARIDNFVHLPEAHISCSLNKERCELCLNYGDKIPVEEIKCLPAGNNNNNAVGATRLKMKTALYCNVGDDGNGRMILDHLKEEGVDPRYVVVHKNIQTDQSVVLTYQGERTILASHHPWEYKLPDLERTKWVYFSSVSSSYLRDALISQIENYIERIGASLAYSPGTYQLNHGVKKFSRLLSLTKVFIINKEEAKKVLGIPEGKKVEIKRLLSGLADLGPKSIVVTDGAEGSFGFDGEDSFWIGTFPANLVEATGAGDAYSTGLLAGLFHGNNLPQAMRWGAANGASVVEQVGAQAGLLTYEKMQEKLKTNSKIIPKRI